MKNDIIERKFVKVIILTLWPLKFTERKTYYKGRNINDELGVLVVYDVNRDLFFMLGCI